MSKITAEHLARTAYVYIRQSHPHQVKHNLESQRRQYGLADRGRELGWSEITIIDEARDTPARVSSALVSSGC